MKTTKDVYYKVSYRNAENKLVYMGVKWTTFEKAVAQVAYLKSFVEYRKLKIERITEIVIKENVKF